MLYFRDICSLLEEVQTAKGVQNKNAVLQKGFAKLRGDTQFSVQENYEAFYKGMRLLVPKLDRARKSYNMKENKIARTIIKMLNLSEGPDKRNLLNYYKIQNVQVTLDLADIVQTVLRKYISNKQSTVTVPEVDEFLDSIANRTSVTELDDLMVHMFKKFTTQESKWIIRIMLKELKLGIDNNKILNIFHQDAAEYYMSNNNLKKVCEVLWNPSIKLNEFTIQIFEPFQPMLSKRCDAKSFSKDFPDNKLFFIENKFDGERFQLHMENGKFKYFSRNGFDFTDKFGNTFSSGIMTPKLKDVFQDNVKSLILDGEMMLWNKKIKKFGSKGMTFDVKKLNDLGCYQPCFCVFDMLLLNGEVLTNKELVERLKLLRKVIKRTIEGTIIMSHYEESISPEKIITALNQSMDNEEEGIIVKDPRSIYKYKDRKGGWYKIKMEYFDEGVTDMDLILMGGFYKANSKELNSFLVGVLSDDNYYQVLSLGRVSSGLNFEETELVNKKLNEKGNSFDKFAEDTMGKLIFGNQVPNIWIEPEHSLIFTVRATELIRSKDDSYRAPYTLRFPRIMKIRNDKSFKDCLSINELLGLCHQNKPVIKLNKRHLELADILSVKRRKKSKKLDVNIEAFNRTSNCLSDMKFYVLNGREELTVDKIEGLIVNCGGTFTLSLEQDVDIVLVGRVSTDMKELLKNDNKFDILKVDWLQRVVDTKCLQRYRQDEVLSIGISYYNCLADEVDMYGDSYTEKINVESLKSRLELMAEKDISINLNGSVNFKSDLPLFNKYSAYFDRTEVINDPSSELIYESFMDEIEFSYRNGTIVNSMGPEVNLVIMGSSNEDRKLLLRKYAASINCRNFQVVEKSQLYDEEEL